MNREPISPYLWMLTGSFAFAWMGALVHELGDSYDWQVIALARTGLALVFGATLAYGANARLVFWRPPILWVRSVAGSFSLVCTFYALTRLPISDVLTLTNMFPLWVAVLSWPVLKERPSAQVWISVLISLVGVFLIQQPHFAERNFASLAALVGSFFTAVAMIGLHRLQGIDARAIVIHFSGVAVFFCIASFFVFERTLPSANHLDSKSLWMLLGVGGSATVGQLFLTKAFASGSPAKISVIGLTQVVFAMAFDVWWWGRSFSPATLLGIGLVLAPTAWLMADRAWKHRKKLFLLTIKNFEKKSNRD